MRTWLVLLVVLVLLAGLSACGEAPGEGGDGAELVGKLEGFPATDGYAAAAWAHDDATLAGLWEQFGLAGEPPAVGDGIVLLAATGESGSCPLELDDISAEPGAVTLGLVQPGRACTDDFNPVTFVLRASTDVAADGSVTVDFRDSDTAVTLTGPGEVVGAPYGQR